MNMKRIIEVEWKHLDVKGETCDRCFSTGETLKQQIAQLNHQLNNFNIELLFKETKLAENEVVHSNEVYIDHKAIESIINLEVRDNYCASCSDLTKKLTYCRSIVFESKSYDEIPASALRKAILLQCGLNPQMSLLNSIYR